MQREMESMRVTAEAQIGVPHLHIRECQEQPPVPRSKQRALDSFPPSEPSKGASHANTLIDQWLLQRGQRKLLGDGVLYLDVIVVTWIDTSFKTH